MGCHSHGQIIVLIAIGLFVVVLSHYEADWSSLDKRPLPAWYNDAKFGIFIHWGVFSVPSIGSEWFWQHWRGEKYPDLVKFMKENYPPTFKYADFAPKFTAEFYNATQWAEILAASGARYVVLTSKHHEGFTNWPSKYSWNWNSVDTGPHRDLVGELASAIRKFTKMRFGLYYSLYEWFNPLYLEDKKMNFKQTKYVDMVMLPQLNEIVTKYKPEVVWSDGDWEAPDTYWNSTQFLAWLYNDSPVKDTVVSNDRWGRGVMCKHGGFYTCSDRYNPGKLQKHKWENCMTIDRDSWGYRRTAQLADYLDMDNLTQVLAETVSCGGNLLMNIGPTHDGRIVAIFEERLRDMGRWLKVNGEAIYGTRPWTTQRDPVSPHVWYTAKGSTVYAILLEWPVEGQVKLGAPLTTKQTDIDLLGDAGGEPLPWRSQAGTKGLVVDVSRLRAGQLPCEWAWVLRLDNVRDGTDLSPTADRTHNTPWNDDSSDDDDEL